MDFVQWVKATAHRRTGHVVRIVADPRFGLADVFSHKVSAHHSVDLSTLHTLHRGAVFYLQLPTWRVLSLALTVLSFFFFSREQHCCSDNDEPTRSQCLRKSWPVPTKKVRRARPVTSPFLLSRRDNNANHTSKPSSNPISL